MIVTTRHSEEKLIALSSKVQQNKALWRAIYFFNGTTAEYKNREEVRLQVVVNAIQKYVGADQGNLFFLHGGDIVLLTQGIDPDRLHAICTSFEALFPDEGGQRNAAMVLDLSIDFDKFKGMAEQKLLAVEEQRAANKMVEEKEEIRAVQVDEKYAREVLAKRPMRDKLVVQLVEDDPFTLALVSNVLGDYCLVKSSDGVDAVEGYMLNAPNIVFLDINIPSMNGHEVLEKILEFDPQAYVVMLSGNSFMEDVSRAIKNGAKGFVTKPFPKEKLLNYVQLYKTEYK